MSGREGMMPGVRQSCRKDIRRDSPQGRREESSGERPETYHGGHRAGRATMEEIKIHRAFAKAHRTGRPREAGRPDGTTTRSSERKERWRRL